MTDARPYLYGWYQYVAIVRFSLFNRDTCRDLALSPNPIVSPPMFTFAPPRHPLDQHKSNRNNIEATHE
jgi:hypothetical protein